jgi:hypothetical protein
MGGLSFLSPLFLIGAIAAAVPILLHLFHRKTEVVIDFPAVSLLKRAPVQLHRRRKLRELLLLALRVAALLLLALSFARPYLAGASAPSSQPLTVLAVDTSMSMTAPGQMDRARDAALRAASAAPGSHALALIRVRRRGDGHRRADDGSIGDRGGDLAVACQRHGHALRTALARASEIIGTREVTWSSSRICSSPDGNQMTTAGCRMVLVST